MIEFRREEPTEISPTSLSLSIASKDSPAAQEVKAEYEREVTKLMQSCRSQKLYAEIVREGGAALGVHSMQAIANLTGRPIVVQTVDGTESPFPDVAPSEGGKVSIFRKTRTDFVQKPVAAKT